MVVSSLEAFRGRVSVLTFSRGRASMLVFRGGRAGGLAFTWCTPHISVATPAIDVVFIFVTMAVAFIIESIVTSTTYIIILMERFIFLHRIGKGATARWDGAWC
jgi:hypothetical protein